MARTFKTEPLPVLAPRRLAAPFRTVRQESRRANATRAAATDTAPTRPSPTIDVAALARRSRIITTRARPGYLHPATAHDLRRALQALGAPALYGLRSIELRHAPPVTHGRLAFGVLLVPGRVLLYEQPQSPWKLAGSIAMADAGRLRRAGASVIYDPVLDRSEIIWPNSALRRFMLADVLLHELGHHCLQHHHGKRTARVVRTSDHEDFALRWAEQWRPRVLGALEAA